ncbi:MAG TPA: NAD(P)/FAD-dependent oxidoreductase, partial [Alphaproteobacteria bacterium]|nr:NAD(P)/FAD-dependent oxidoreductase [Alphaproteobacteria bacterium]
MEAATQYDLIVVGAGPAGNACAITSARAGANVLLLEKDRFPRHKVCGEFVSSEALRLLDSLLGRPQFSSRLEIDSARIFLETKPERAAQSLQLPVSPPALSIPRFDLDAALLASARGAGVRVEETMPALDVRRNGMFQVSTARQTFTAKAVVNASGRWSKLSRREIAPQERWIGLKAHFSEASARNSVDLYFFPGGYCGVTPLGKDSVNACAMVRADAAHSLPQVFAQHPELWRRSRSWEPLVPEITTSPLFFHEPETESDGVLQTGDAAGFI